MQYSLSFVIDNRRSPWARLRSVPLSAVTMKDGFWKTRMERNYRTALPTLLAHLESHGVVDNFRRLAFDKTVERKGPLYTDSDLYKWLEAAGYALYGKRDEQLLKVVDEIIATIERAQEPSGYINTWFVEEREHERLTWVEKGSHELYCGGHLIQAGLAIYRSLGDRRLLDVGIKFADYLCEVYGPGKKQGFSGHPEIEMALVELYRETGQERYLELAGFLLEQAGYEEMDELAGHAVRALYFACGLADYYMETGDPKVGEVLELLWQSMTTQKSYITGGVGGRHQGESVGKPYELPNARAYAETCAAIAAVFWSYRMLTLKGEGRYCDQMETALYNGFLAGVSLEGDAFFYVNPLKDDGLGQKDPWWESWRKGPHRRKSWYTTTCCPTNSVRFLASLPGYFFSTTEAGVWVHLYDNSILNWQLPAGGKFSLQVNTSYPWDGRIELVVNPEKEGVFSIFLRIPGWAEEYEVEINGEALTGPTAVNGYLELHRLWQSGDRIVLNLRMEPMFMAAHPRLAENRNSLALKRGPLVYCFEGVDNPQIPLFDARLEPDPAWIECRYEPELLEGVVALYCPGEVPLSLPQELYLPLEEMERRITEAAQAVTLKAIPYYAWANRDISPMTVWLERANR